MENVRVILLGRHAFEAPEGVEVVKTVDMQYALHAVDALAQFAKIVRQAQELGVDILLQNIPAQLGFAISCLDFWGGRINIYATINAQRAAEGERPTFYLHSIYNVRTGRTIWNESGIQECSDAFSLDDFYEAINR